MDPQRSARGIQPRGDGARARFRGSERTTPGAVASAAGCTFSGSRATTGSGAASSPARKVTRTRFGASESYSRAEVGTSFGAEEAAAPRVSRSLPVRSTSVATARSARRPRCWDVGRRPGDREGSVANRSVLHPTRLETRTKESNVRASHGARTKPKGATKVREVSGRPRQDPVPLAGRAHCRPVSAASSARRSKSARVGTRKMVNYA